MKFGPERRIRKRPEFQAIQRDGRRTNTPHFVLIVSPAATSDSPARLGVTASRRVGNSVRRSRLKRIIREAFRQLEGFVPPGYDLLVICKADAPDLTTETVVREWLRVEGRIKKGLAPRTPRGKTGHAPGASPGGKSP